MPSRIRKHPTSPKTQHGILLQLALCQPSILSLKLGSSDYVIVFITDQDCFVTLDDRFLVMTRST